MTTGKRAANRASMEDQILTLGRAQLKVRGAADLSLRAIAREMGVASSAVYRYVPSRDDLLTRLLVEAYNDLADTTAGTPDQTDPRARVRSIAESARHWALADPSRWALLYGSPVPGYAAPAAMTTGPGTRVIAQLLAALSQAHRDGLLAARVPCLDPRLQRDLARIRAEFDAELTDQELTAATLLWSTMIGAITLEVFGQYGADSLVEPGLLFTAQIEAVLSLTFE
ncbi:TetR/AcrR family transcriptional regulator [soil metagenome]